MLAISVPIYKNLHESTYSRETRITVVIMKCHYQQTAWELKFLKTPYSIFFNDNKYPKILNAHKSIELPCESKISIIFHG